MPDLTLKFITRYDLASQRWEVWVWNAENCAVVEECDTYDELSGAAERAMEKARKFLRAH